MRTKLITAAILAGLAIPTAASAQMRAQVLAFGDPPRTLPVQLFGTTAGSRPISLAECEANVEIPIEIANIPADANGRVFSVWRGAVGSAMCEASTSRMSTTGMPACTLTDFPAATITTTQITVRPTVQQLFGSTACSAGTNNEQEFFFLIVSSAGDTSTTVANGYFFSLRILLDTQAPSSPTLDPNPGGDTQINVTWENAAGTEALFGANAYVDLAGCDASGNVISTALTPGADPPTDIEPILTEGQSVDTAVLDGAALGLEYGEYAAVGVTLLDRARNESKLSNVVCIQRVQVSGFWDAYCAEHGMTDPAMCRAQYGCSARPGRAGRAAGILGAIGLALAFLVTRRARRSHR